MIPTRTAEDLVLGQWAVLGQFGGAPKLLVWDGEGGVGWYGGPNPKLDRVARQARSVAPMSSTEWQMRLAAVESL